MYSFSNEKKGSRNLESLTALHESVKQWDNESGSYFTFLVEEDGKREQHDQYYEEPEIR